jgi:hypothetical protein
MARLSNPFFRKDLHMARRRNKIRNRPVHINIREDLVARIETIFWDPTREKPIYGAHSYLVTALLELWLRNPAILQLNHKALADLDLKEAFGFDLNDEHPIPLPNDLSQPALGQP